MIVFLVLPCNWKKETTPQEPTRVQYPWTSTKAKKGEERERKQEEEKKAQQKWMERRFWNSIHVCWGTKNQLDMEVYMKDAAMSLCIDKGALVKDMKLYISVTLCLEGINWNFEFFFQHDQKDLTR